MSVLVNVIGEKDGSDEYNAAEKLKGIIKATVPSTAMGELVLYPSATLYGQAVKDVDIMMIGHLQNYPINVKFNHDGTFAEEKVFFESFCTTIEVKSHSINYVRKEGTNIQVKYTGGWHNATRQSNEQKTSAMNFFTNSLGDSPYITNLLWFVEVSDEELDNLLSYKDNTMLSNVLPSSFDFKDLAQALVLQRFPRKWNNRYTFECNFGGKSTDAFSKTLNFFSKSKEGMGELTRKRIEQITQAELDDYAFSLEEDKLTILRGRAGTGKTINLIRAAISLVDEKGSRVQILTYNRALVSDIRRLFALADFPDMFEEKCVSVNTMQSYFYGLINGCLYDGELFGETFLSKYQELLDEMIEFLKGDSDASQIIRELCEENARLNWDYMLIDEAQDWSPKERDLILLLYEKSHVLVADGGQQFVRMVEPCDWTIVTDRKNVKFKYCLRQKNNIVKFINYYSEKIDQFYNKITISGNMVGGKVIIVCDQSKLYEIIKKELKELKKAENIPYDMLYLVPSSLVEHGDTRCFKLKKEFEHRDILIWDGTNEDNRLEYTTDPDAARVLQYESSRGLEGWTVCCMNFDEFLRIKEEQYDPSAEGNALFLESAEDKRKKYLLNWALIPMTRAIDTLIITLKDPDSKVSKMFLELASEHPDYIEII